MGIQHIDRIARIKNRTVLFVSFEPESDSLRTAFEAPNHPYTDYENDFNRKEFIAWLVENNIDWEPCGHFACETGWISYGGNIYVDVPFDVNDLRYVKLQERLEYPDGTMKNPYVKFWMVTLENALKNAHHDEPGFWETWAENF